uniref:Uncharacterized protein n=1 Tax=Arundo donax TaxID=35708 RepID=A0A0A9HC06_ARUDO
MYLLAGQLKHADQELLILLLVVCRYFLTTKPFPCQ